MNLIKQAKQKDSAAFELLIRSEIPSMYRVAASILNNDEDVADAIQETLLKCWEKIDTLKNDSYFKTWLTRILINCCNDIYRKRKPTVSLDEVSEIVSIDKTNTDDWKEIINLLDRNYRVVMELYYVQEFTTKEISKVTGCQMQM